MSSHELTCYRVMVLRESRHIAPCDCGGGTILCEVADGHDPPNAAGCRVVCQRCLLGRVKSAQPQPTALQHTDSPGCHLKHRATQR